MSDIMIGIYLALGAVLVLVLMMTPSPELSRQLEAERKQHPRIQVVAIILGGVVFAMFWPLLVLRQWLKLRRRRRRAS